MTTSSFPRTKTTAVTTCRSTRTKKKTRRKKGKTKKHTTVDLVGVGEEASDWIVCVLCSLFLWLGLPSKPIRHENRSFQKRSLRQLPWNCSSITPSLKLGLITSNNMNIKKMWSPYLFTRQQALKLGYFYRLRVNNSNPLHTGLSLGYLTDAKFYRESKASFIHISSIASFKPFLIAWLCEYWHFSDSSVVSL